MDFRDPPRHNAFRAQAYKSPLWTTNHQLLRGSVRLTSPTLSSQRTHPEGLRGWLIGVWCPKTERQKSSMRKVEGTSTPGTLDGLEGIFSVLTCWRPLGLYFRTCASSVQKRTWHSPYAGRCTVTCCQARWRTKPINRRSVHLSPTYPCLTVPAGHGRIDYDLSRGSPLRIATYLTEKSCLPFEQSLQPAARTARPGGPNKFGVTYILFSPPCFITENKVKASILPDVVARRRIKPSGSLLTRRAPRRSVGNEKRTKCVDVKTKILSSTTTFLPFTERQLGGLLSLF